MKKKMKIIIWVILIGLTLLGSFSGIEKGCWPLYVQKSGNSLGINFCLATKYLPGSCHSGLNFSPITIQSKNSKINGLNFGLYHCLSKKTLPVFEGEELPIIRGANISLINDGIEDGYKGSRKKLYGLEFGIINLSCLYGVQIGIWNQHQHLNGKYQNTLLINIANGK